MAATATWWQVKLAHRVLSTLPGPGLSFLCSCYIGAIFGFYRGYVGVILYWSYSWGYIGIKENRMETTI